MKDLVTIQHISKNYGYDTVIQGLSLSIQPNRIIGIIGPNGSGKSTLLKMIAGILAPDEGTIVTGNTVISYLLQEKDYYDWMKVKDAVAYYRDFYDDFNKEKALKLLEEAKIPMNQLIRKLSTGNQQRLCMSLALSRKVDLYLLDEPLSGADPDFKEDYKRFLLENVPEEATIVMVTHLLKDMETMFDDVLIMRDKHYEYVETEWIREQHQSVEQYYLGGECHDESN